MSAEYIAYINDQEFGPVSYDDLNDMWARDEIANETQVRFSSNPTWVSWQAVRTAHVTEEAEQARATQPPPIPIAIAGERAAACLPGAKDEIIVFINLPSRRDKLRKLTAYPVLRGCLIAIIVIGILGTAIFGVALFNDDERSLAITGLIACLSSIFSSFVTMVILDIADASLRKIE